MLSLALLFIAVSGVRAAGGRTLTTETALLLAIAFKLRSDNVTVSYHDWTWGGSLNLFRPTAIASKVSHGISAMFGHSIRSFHVLCLIAAGVVM